MSDRRPDDIPSPVPWIIVGGTLFLFAQPIAELMDWMFR